MLIRFVFTIIQDSLIWKRGDVVVVIVWQLDLQLPLQVVSIVTNVVSSNPTNGEMYSIQRYVIKFVSDLRQFSPCTSSIKLTTTIIQKLALNTITLTPNLGKQNSGVSSDLYIILDLAKGECVIVVQRQISIYFQLYEGETKLHYDDMMIMMMMMMLMSALYQTNSPISVFTETTVRE